MAVVFEQVRRGITLASVGQSWTTLEATLDGDEFDWQPVLTEYDNGTWEALIQFADPGTWRWYGESSDGTGWVIQVDVTLAPATEPAVPIAVDVPVVLSDIRLAVGSRIRDVVVLTATADGTESTIIDARQLLDADDAYISTWGIVMRGTAANVGEVFRVIDSSQAAFSLTVHPALPVPTATGDVVHLFNLMGKGFRPQYYNLEIAEVVADAYPDFMVRVTADIADPFNDSTGRVEIPAAMTWVYDLQWMRGTDDWVPVQPKYWTVDSAYNSVVVRGDSAKGRLHGERLRVSGLGRHPNVEYDNDPIAIDREYVVLATAARLARRRTTAREWTDAARQWEQQTQQMLGDRATVLPNNAQRVR